MNESLNISPEEFQELELKPLGQFIELEHGTPACESLRDAICATPNQDEEKIIAYLENGFITAVAACTVRDVLSESEKSICGLYGQTDLVWHWYSDLAYYVKTYHVQLPEAFIQHIKSKNWMMGEVPEKYKLESSQD
jgi:hypothetical protein